MRVLVILSVFYLAVNAVQFEDHLNLDPAFNGTNWVVLCAGSNTWYNYRHQSDVYHAYQVIKSHGIPDSNIIVMHYDDIANAKQNPMPGVVINRPNGPDVYKGVPKDYVGEDVNPSNFLSVLRGDSVLARDHKKVVNSGPNDHIFVYFVDHGSNNLVAFPHKYLYAKELAETLITMHKNNRFAKLVFYMEACHSGSMFEKLLPKDINIYVTASSGPTESSYLCWDDSKIHTYLSDPYTAAWLYDSEHKDLTKETLQEQYNFIEMVINKSVDHKIQHSHQYGDLSIAKLPVSQFLGSKKPPQALNIALEPKDNCDAIPSQDVFIHIKQKQISSTNDINEKQRYLSELSDVLKGRQYVDKVLYEYIESIKHLTNLDTNSVLNTKQELNNMDCYRKFVDTFNDKCFNINEHNYAFNKLGVFVNICDALGKPIDVDIAVNHLSVFCAKYSDHSFNSIQ